MAAAAAASGAGPGRPAPGADARDTVTFARDIAPLLYAQCAGCHYPGGPAPFSVLAYEDAAPRAALIAAAVQARRMPPWLPAPGRGGFAGERRLSEREIALLEHWAALGAPEGDPAQLPPPPERPDGWQLGRPDVVVTLEEPYVLPAGDGEVFRNFVLSVPLTGPRYVRDVELQPGSPHVVHHAMVMVDPSGASRRLDDRDQRPGFAGMHLPTEVHMPQGFFLGWTPGRVPAREPDGFAWRLEPGTDLVLQLHLRPDTTAHAVLPRIGLYVADGPPAHTPTTLKLGSEAIDIPAGEPRHVVTDSYVLPVDADVLGVYPHAHYLARDIRAHAELPDGRTAWLIHIPEWDFNWQDVYAYAEPVRLPRGTRIVVRFTYDNSAANPRNPHRPPRRVVYGPHSTDEMGDFWIRVLPQTAADLAVLHRDFAYKSLANTIAGLEFRLRLDRADADARLTLANLLLSLGRREDAAQQYRVVLRDDPENGNAHYNLGVALQGLGRLPEAAEHYRHAVALIPGHVEAHTNLGNTLAALGDLAGAAQHYRKALAEDPSSADAHHNLGVVLSASAPADEVIRHFREALRVRPDWVAPLNALAWLLATHPAAAVRDTAGAVRLAERAAALTVGKDPAVLNTLAAAYAAAGAFDRAVSTAREALALAHAAGAGELAREIAALLDLYAQRKPYRM